MPAKTGIIKTTTVKAYITKAKKMRTQATAVKKLGLLALAGLIFTAVGCGLVSKDISSLEDVKKYVPGIWTSNKFLGCWSKYVLNSDGTGEKYFAQPDDNDWGKATILKWEPATSKYTDTGERWYGLNYTADGEYGPESATLILSDSETLYRTSSVNPSIEYKRGDVFPFSK